MTTTEIDSKQIKKNFGQKIYDIRQKKGLSAKQFGRLIGVNSTSVSNWENTKTFLSRESYDKVVALFPEMKDQAAEAVIQIEKKNSGKSSGYPGTSKKGRKISPPARPPIRPQVKKPPAEESSVETNVSSETTIPAPAPAKKVSHPKKRPVFSAVKKPISSSPASSGGVRLVATPQLLARLIRSNITTKEGREAFIKTLRESSVSDSFILDVLAAILP